MTMDIQHKSLEFKTPVLEHAYGDKVRLLKNPYLMSLLTKLSHPETKQPFITWYVREIYERLISEMVSELFPRVKVSSDTRMKEQHAEAVYEGEIIDPNTKVVSVDLARAGILPSQTCYDKLNYLLNPDNVRQDHFILNRTVDNEGKVTGVDISGSKIGGDIDKSFVLFADPMGATGGTICHAVDYYKNHVEGTAARFVAMHLIITPEYIKKLKDTCPDVEIYAVRLDRGLSSPEILETIPGTHIDQERGLNDIQYIVPGAGGLGEILNNAFV